MWQLFLSIVGVVSCCAPLPSWPTRAKATTWCVVCLLVQDLPGLFHHQKSSPYRSIPPLPSPPPPPLPGTHQLRSSNSPLHGTTTPVPRMVACGGVPMEEGGGGGALAEPPCTTPVCGTTCNFHVHSLHLFLSTPNVPFPRHSVRSGLVGSGPVRSAILAWVGAGVPSLASVQRNPCRSSITRCSGCLLLLRPNARCRFNRAVYLFTMFDAEIVC